VAALMQSLDECEELCLPSPPDTFGINKKKREHYFCSK
jgi:hypothetical protein